MSGYRFTARHTPDLRVDLRGITPAALAGRSLAQVEQLPLAQGHALVPLAEFFQVQPHDEGTLLFDADLARFDRVGWALDSGRIEVAGSVGHHAGGGMRGGELVVLGSAGTHAACEMAGGLFSVAGNVGDFAASTLPGSMDGMRGGSFIVRGNAGERFADRMRRGTAVVFGNTGGFLASRMVAGTVAVGGSTGAHCAIGMRRGSLVFAAHAPDLARTFVPAGAEAPVFWQLLARDLARHGGPFAGLAARAIRRHLGDLADSGKGEVIQAL